MFTSEHASGAKVLIGPSSFADADRAPLDRLISSGFQVIANPVKRKLDKSELRALLGEGPVGLIAGLEPLDRDVLTGSTLKVISRCGSGMTNVDLVAARELGIKVFNTPSAPANAVAEMTLGCLLGLLRHVTAANTSMHARAWEKRLGAELRGKTVAVVGYGRIGQQVGRLLLAFGAEVVAVDPVRPETAEARWLPLDDALRVADVVTIHASGEECLLGAREFGLMKPGACLLNAARGGLIDEQALLEALDGGRIARAWLDTFREEPYRGPLCDYPQVMMTPHLGSYTAECRRSMEMEAVENLLRGLADR